MFPRLLLRREGPTLLTERCVNERIERTGLRHEVAAEDAVRVIVMMELRTEDAMGAGNSHIAFRSEQHPKQRRGEIHPEISPEMRRKRGGEAARRIHAHAGDWSFNRYIRSHKRAREKTGPGVELRLIRYNQHNEHESK